MKKMIIAILIIIAVVLAVIFCYFFVGSAPEAKHITWGVDFSQMQAETLKLDWKQTYLAILEDLGAKNIKLHTQWDFVEGKKDVFYFDDTDWQVAQAQSHDAKLIYVVGMKTGRWPECHIPAWADGLSKEQQQAEILTYVTQVVNRYKGSPAIYAWQAENEPLFNFGECPWYDKDFLTKEVALIKSLDPTRPVIISDSGEQSLWLDAGKIGDIVGVTMYRKLWFSVTKNFGFYATFPLPPVFYQRRAQIIQYLFHKTVICVELQAEPWAYKQFYNLPLSEQEKTMNLQQLKDNVSYAKATGFNTFYFWGVEYWYWLKTTQNQPALWDYEKGIFQKP